MSLKPDTFITDASDPRLAPYANLKDAELRRTEWEGSHSLFLCESELVVRALLASRHEIASVLCTPAAYAQLAGAMETARAGDRGLPAKRFETLIASEELLHSITGFNFHRGVMAAGVRGTQPTLSDVLKNATSVLLLEGIANHDNIGALFRNAAGLGGERPVIVVGPQCCDPLYRKAIRVSIGHVLHVDWIKVQTWHGVFEAVRAAGFEVIALSPRPDAVAIREASNRIKKPALLLGAEGPGLTDATMNAADVLVRIPMRQGVDSLNVATSAAVALSWFVRQE
ncbi:MAG: RNA methyltransferase [Phycisphaerales bacterium]